MVEMIELSNDTRERLLGLFAQFPASFGQMVGTLVTLPTPPARIRRSEDFIYGFPFLLSRL